MESNVNTQLKHAKKLYDSKKYEESLNLYELIFNENPDEFKLHDRISYSWAIYQAHVKGFADENELFDATDFITDLIPQADLNRSNTCPYTFSVFRVLDYLYEEKEYYNISYWLDKLDPELLDEKKNNYGGRVTRSRKEKYYDYASKSNLECAEWDLCIEVSKEALETLKSFTNNSDTWYRWRIAKALRQLNQNQEALKYLSEVVNVKDEWFVHKEFAENLHELGEDDNAMASLRDAVLTDDAVNVKVNLYYLAYEVLDALNMDEAYMHLELYYLLKLEGKRQIPEEIQELDIDETQLDKDELISKINDFWNAFKFKDQKLQHGIVTNIIEDKNFGFIKNDDEESIFFHKSEVNGDDIHVGDEVSFYTVENFDKSKNKESVKAVCIKGE